MIFQLIIEGSVRIGTGRGRDSTIQENQVEIIFQKPEELHVVGE